MKKVEKVLWGIGLGAVTAANFLLQQKDAVEFMKLPAIVFNVASFVALVGRNVQLYIASKKIVEKKDGES